MHFVYRTERMPRFLAFATKFSMGACTGLQVGFLWTGAVNVCHNNQLLNGLALGGIQDWHGVE